MRTVADLHTHTSVSQHAYSTLYENIQAARRLGFCALGMTNHAPGMPDGAISHHFYCLPGLPKTMDGLRLYRGAEVNIMDFDGTVDLEPRVLERLDFVVASYHVECITPGTREQNTRGFLKAIANPYVDCIGHCGNPVFPIDIPAVVSACREHGKLVEINSNSPSVRPGSKEVCTRVALECIRQGVKMLVSSDAHFCGNVGNHHDALELLESIHCPEELVVNSSRERLAAYFAGRPHNPLAD